MKPEDYAINVIRNFEQYANPEMAVPMKSYMKDQFEFFGIKAPFRSIITRAILSGGNLPNPAEIGPIALELWQKPQRELQYFVIDLLIRLKKKMPRSSMEIYEHLIIQKSWWDTVDLLASHCIGAYFINYPDAIKSRTSQWINGNNLWLQRTALLFQLKYKSKTDEDLLFDFTERLMNSREFFIRKAIGWALREYSKVNPNAVDSFVRTHQLSPLSEREALKYILKTQEASPEQESA